MRSTLSRSTKVPHSSCARLPSPGALHCPRRRRQSSARSNSIPEKTFSHVRPSTRRATSSGDGMSPRRQRRSIASKEFSRASTKSISPSGGNWSTLVRSGRETRVRASSPTEAATSRTPGRSVATAQHPEARASSRTSGSPSKRDGRTKSVLDRKRDASASWERAPCRTMRSPRGCARARHSASSEPPLPTRCSSQGRSRRRNKARSIQEHLSPGKVSPRRQSAPSRTAFSPGKKDVGRNRPPLRRYAPAESQKASRSPPPVPW